MMIDGKVLADEMFQELRVLSEAQSPKKVAFVCFLSTPATDTFIKVKTRAAAKLSIETIILTPVVTNTNEAVAYLERIAVGVDAIVVQLPLPDFLDTTAVLNAVIVAHDVDVLSTASLQAYKDKTTTRIPPVAHAIWQVLEKYGGELKNKKIVLLGNGRLVGGPTAQLLSKTGIPFEIYDKLSDSKKMFDSLSQADVIVSGIGSPHFIQPDMIKMGVLLIDAGTSEQSGKVVGDFDPSCYTKASFYTPVPGGVGPMTVACLYWNLFRG